VQSCPVQDADIVRIQIKTLCEERAQLAVGACMRQRLPQLHHTTPLTAGGVTRLAGVGHEVRVVLGSHAKRLVAPSANVREMLHRTPGFL